MKIENILVVDDNYSIRIVISEMLSRIGYGVSSADSGEHGLGLFLKHKFNVVLSDFQMPGMDGIAFASRIKKCAPSTPVVIMTGAINGTACIQHNIAVDDVIYKPFTLDQLRATIHKWSGKAHQAIYPPAPYPTEQPNQARDVYHRNG
jgi:CheY-like chemotaxis protein